MKRAWIGAVGSFCVAFSVYVWTLAPTLTWQHDGADGGDLVRAAVMGSVPHPSGYPTYLLAARLFLLLPFGTEAYRLNLLSAFFAAVTVALFYMFAVARQRVRGSWFAQAGAAVATLVLAFSSMVWSQAVITEVYSLHLFFTVAVLVSIHYWRQRRQTGTFLLAGLFTGLGLGNHLTLVLLVPGLLVLVASARMRGITLLMAGLVAGLSVYLYLVFGAQAGVDSPWGPLDSPARFVTHVTADLYRGYLFAVTPADFLARVASLLRMLLSDFQIWGIALATYGLFGERKRNPVWSVALICTALAVSIFAAGYRTADSFRYLLPVWVCVALWYAEGTGVVLASVSEWTMASPRAGHSSVVIRRLAAAGLVVFLILGGAGFAFTRFPQLDLSRDYEAEQFATQTLLPLPSDAILISAADQHTFALWYYTDVRQVRPDVIVVDRDLFTYAPYREYLGRRWPGLAMEHTDVDVWIGANRDSHPVFVVDAQAQVYSITAEDTHATTR